MRTLFRRVDPGFFLVIGIAFLAIWPFLSRASLPTGTDAELHIFRLHELSLLLQGGEYYPRWAPNFYHGYGYPIFNYYAPLSYYVGALFLLGGLFTAVTAVKAVFISGLLLAAIGMYGFVRDNWGRPAAYVAAALYVYAPYVQYVDPHARGVMPESFCLGLFPLALWAVDRLRRTGSAAAWTTAVGLSAAVSLSHNLIGPLFWAILWGWALWQWVLSKRNTAVVPPWLPVTAVGLGLLLASFFWLPVYLERDAVTLNTLIGQNNNYDFRTHFLSLAEMLRFSAWLDWGATEPAFHFNLGVAQWLLTAVGLLALLLGRAKQAGAALYFALGWLLLLFLMWPASVWLWEAVPVLPFFQFPWRLLGPAAAVGAIVAGVGVEAGWQALAAWPRAQLYWPAGLVLATLALALPLTQPPPWADFGEVNTLRLSLIENTGRWLGTTSTADYVPATVDTVPGRKGSVVGGLAEGKPMDRVNYETLPEGATIETEQLRPLTTRYTLNTPKSTHLRLYLFDFPGWQVTVDGQPVQTELGRPDGFIVVPVPAGSHVIEVQFGSTPARTAAGWLTAVALLLWLAGAGWRWRVGGTATAVAVAWARYDLVLATAVGLFLLLTLFVLQPLGLLHKQSTGFVAETAQTAIFADFGGQIALIGYSGPRSTAVAGQMVPIELYWKAQTAVEINFQVFVHLLTADGRLVAQSDKINPGEFPTKWWPADKYVRDTHWLSLPADLPPGEYRLTVGLWVQAEGWRLPLLVDGQQVGDVADLLTLTVKEK